MIRVLSSLISIVGLAAACMLAGCNMSPSTQNAGPVTVAKTVALRGVVHGGQQPITQSTIQLYAVGTTGYGAGATPLLTSAVTTDGSGFFSITGKWTCTPGTLVYITATGGDPGVGGNNSAINIMAALGPCDNLTASSSITINELTTVAAVWALAPFLNGMSVGAPTTNSAGLTAAFNDLAKIIDNGHGTTPGPSLPSTVTVPTAMLNTLADILAACINSTGPSSIPCNALFTFTTPAGGIAPTDTLTAALNMAQHPAQNVANLLTVPTPNSPFQPLLSVANDFTIGITYSVGSTPINLAVDASGNVWVANSGSAFVSKLSRSNGARTDYSAGGISDPKGIAIDLSGNIWIANSTTNTLSALLSTGTPLTGSPFSGGGLNQPTALAIDPFDTVWVANAGAQTMSAFNASGTPISTSAGYATTGGSSGAGTLAIAVNPN
jgi:hypothetical protein